MKLLLPLLFTVFFLTSNTVAQETPIRVGVILPLSGEAQLAGEQIRSGIEKASATGVQFVFEDDVCSSMKSLSVYRRLSDLDKFQFFLGPCCSSPMKVVAPHIAKAAQVSMGICGLSEPILDSGGGHLFSPHYSIEAEDSFLASRMTEVNIRKVAIVFWDNDFSRAHESGFRKAFPGVAVSFPFVSFDIGTLRPILLKLKGKNFDAVYVPLVEPLVLGLMKELRNIGLGDLKVFSIYGAQMPGVIATNGAAADGLIYSHPKIPLGEDADVYFPKLGAELLSQAIVGCMGDYDCVLQWLKNSGRFDTHGASRQELELRTIKGGKFVKLPEEEYRQLFNSAP